MVLLNFLQIYVKMAFAHYSSKNCLEKFVFQFFSITLVLLILTCFCCQNKIEVCFVCWGLQKISLIWTFGVTKYLDVVDHS